MRSGGIIRIPANEDVVTNAAERREVRGGVALGHDEDAYSSIAIGARGVQLLDGLVHRVRSVVLALEDDGRARPRALVGEPNDKVTHAAGVADAGDIPSLDADVGSRAQAIANGRESAVFE